MQPNISQSQTAFDMGFANAEEFRMACERGRMWAAMAVGTDPLKKKEMEAKYGEEFCRNRWPEAYIGDKR